MTNTAARLSTLETEVSGIRTDLSDMKAMLTAYLDAQAPASEPLTVTFAREEKARDERVSKARKTRKAKKADPVARMQAGLTAKADLSVEVLGRKAWNDLFSVVVRTSGLRDKRDVSLYRVSMNRWNEVQDLRNGGASVNEAVAAIKGTKKWAKRA